MHKSRAHVRNEAHRPADRVTALQPRQRASILGLAWWWRHELGIALGLAAGLYLLARAAGSGRTVLGVAVAIVLFGLWPVTRRAVTAVAWVIITPHRLRVGFVRAHLHARNGRLPTILRTSQQPFGERVLVWCQPGTAAADFRLARGILAAACWVTAIRVSTDEWHTNLVTIDVIRRRPSPQSTPALSRADRRRAAGG
jgi:hypothetical protein